MIEELDGLYTKLHPVALPDENAERDRRAVYERIWFEAVKVATEKALYVVISQRNHLLSLTHGQGERTKEVMEALKLLGETALEIAEEL